MKLYIQNMVCLCCKMTVSVILNKMNVEYTSIELGEVDLKKQLTKSQRQELKTVLHEYGLELMEDEKAILVEKIVTIIIDMIHNSNEFRTENFSIF